LIARQIDTIGILEPDEIRDGLDQGREEGTLMGQGLFVIDALFLRPQQQTE
jgi:hypothetical protein